MRERGRTPTLTGIGYWLAALAAALGLFAVFEPSFAWQHALVLAGCFGTAATGWTVFAGFGGQFSFGHGAIFGLAAYGTFFLNEWWDVPPLAGVVVASVLVALASLTFVVPALRLRGPYFALVTLALAEIARRWIDTARDQTGGQDGRIIPNSGSGILHLSSGDKQDFVRWAVVLLISSAGVAWLFIRSRRGRELTAVRDEQDVAEFSGIETTRVKAYGFFVSAVLTGLAGGLYAYYSHIVASDALLSTSVSILILEVAVVGGIRSVFGPALGALFLISIQELLRVHLGATSPSAHRLVFAGVFGVMLFVAPSGLVGLGRAAADRRRRGNEQTVGEPRRRHAPAATDALGMASAAEIGALLSDLVRLERSAAALEPPADLVVSDLTKRFGGQVVNDRIDVRLESGTSVGVWGPNGSGKSTLVNVLGGQLRADSGAIMLGSRRIQRLAPHERARLGIVRASQQARLYESQSVVDNLTLTLFSTKRLNPMRERDHRSAEALAFRALDAVGLSDRLGSLPAGNLSTGQRKRLEIARVVVGHRPRVVLLDEPTAGVDAAGIPQLVEVLEALKAGTGASVIVVDHDSEFLRRVVDSFVLLERGRVVDYVDSRDAALDVRLRGHMVTEQLASLP